MLLSIQLIETQFTTCGRISERSSASGGPARLTQSNRILIYAKNGKLTKCDGNEYYYNLN